MVEIADKSERIEAFLPQLDTMVTDGMITLDSVRILAYRHDAASDSSSVKHT